MRFEQLLEAKNVYDHRHENISDIIKPWAGGDKYIDPRDGFYWIFSKRGFTSKTCSKVF